MAAGRTAQPVGPRVGHPWSDVHVKKEWTITSTSRVPKTWYLNTSRIVPFSVYKITNKSGNQFVYLSDHTAKNCSNNSHPLIVNRGRCKNDKITGTKQQRFNTKITHHHPQYCCDSQCIHHTIHTSVRKGGKTHEKKSVSTATLQH